MTILGIDEVGRGCLAGPLVVGAVVLDQPIEGLKDSKLLTRKRREQLSAQIWSKAAFIGIGWVAVDELDSLGLSNSLNLGAHRALTGFNIDCDRIILDGNYDYVKTIPLLETIIRADTVVPAVSAASIVAKVARDSYMLKLAADFPQYQFDRNVGYGTKAHLQAIKAYGACIHHRHSFKPIKTMD